MVYSFAYHISFAVISIVKESTIYYFWFAAISLCWLTTSVPIADGAAQQVVSIDEFDSRWRRTSQGWVDLARWNGPSVTTVERPIELVHPLVFSMVLLLTAIGMLIWATNEDQWAVVFTRSPDKKNNGGAVSGVDLLR